MERNEEVEKFAAHLYTTWAIAAEARPMTVWGDMRPEKQKPWVTVAIIALQADKPQYRLEIVRSTPITVPHLRLKPPRGKEIILAGEQLTNMAGARRTAKHLAEAARRGFRIVEVIENPKVIA